MWRLNVRRQYAERLFEVKKFFLNGRYEFASDEPLLLQIVKQDESGRFLGRIRGILFFSQLVEDALAESVKLYQVKWKYVILPNRVIRLPVGEWFNIDDVIGNEAAERYYGQAEAVKLREEDERAVRNRLSKYLE